MMGIALTLTLSAWFFPLRLPPVGTRRTMLVDFWKQQRKFPLFALPAASINTVSAQLPVLIVASRFGTEIAGYLAMLLRLIGAVVQLLGRSVLEGFTRNATERFRPRGGCPRQEE